MLFTHLTELNLLRVAARGPDPARLDAALSLSAVVSGQKYDVTNSEESEKDKDQSQPLLAVRQLRDRSCGLHTHGCVAPYPPRKCERRRSSSGHVRLPVAFGPTFCAVHTISALTLRPSTLRVNCTESSPNARAARAHCPSVFTSPCSSRCAAPLALTSDRCIRLVRLAKASPCVSKARVRLRHPRVGM